MLFLCTKDARLNIILDDKWNVTTYSGAEFAMESNEWKNGLFTYCLLFGLHNGSADLDKDGKIMLSELQLYTTDRVTQLSKGKQTPTTRIQNIQLDYQIW